MGAQATSSYVCGGDDSRDDADVGQREREERAQFAEAGRTLSARRARGLRCFVVRGRCLTRQGRTSGRHREPQMRFRLAIIGRPGRAVNTKDDKLQ
jgi:hypothetical protein